MQIEPRMTQTLAHHFSEHDSALFLPLMCEQTKQRRGWPQPIIDPRRNAGLSQLVNFFTNIKKLILTFR